MENDTAEMFIAFGEADTSNAGDELTTGPAAVDSAQSSGMGVDLPFSSGNSENPFIYSPPDNSRNCRDDAQVVMLIIEMVKNLIPTNLFSGKWPHLHALSSTTTTTLHPDLASNNVSNFAGETLPFFVSSSSNGHHHCKPGTLHYNDKSLPNIFLLAMANAFVLSLIWSQNRKSRRLSMADGRPSLLKPFPITEPCRFRLTYVAFWAMVAYDGIQILLQNAGIFIDTSCADIWEKPAIVIVNVLIFAVLFFPVIGGISTDTTLGYIVSTAWIWALTVQRCMAIVATLMKDTKNGAQYDKTQKSIEAFSYAILVFSMLFLSIILPIRLVQGLYLYFVGKRSSQFETVNPPVLYAKTAEALYVKELFKKPPPQPISRIKSLLNKVMIYRNVPYFRYSHVMLSTIMIGGIFIYYIIFLDVFMLTLFGNYLLPVIFSAIDFQSRIVLTFPSLRRVISQAYNITIDEETFQETANFVTRVLQSHVWCVYYSNAAALCFVGFLQLILLVSLLTSYRTDRLRVQRGQYSIIRPRYLQSGRSVIGGAVRYMGFQAIMFAWGMLAQIVLFTSIGVIIGFAVVIPQLYGYGDYIKNFMLSLLPAFAMTVAVLFLHQVAVTCFFLKTPCSHVLTVNNPRGYSNFAYLFFFKNLFIGIIYALYRFALSIVIGTMMFSRLDMPTVTPLFQVFDTGFRAYEGFIHLENAHMNPTLVTFVNIVLERTKAQTLERRSLRVQLIRQHNLAGVTWTAKTSTDFRINLNDVDTEKKAVAIEKQFKQQIEADRKKRCIRFKWQLYRTLTRNPILAVDRKRSILYQFKIREHFRKSDR